MYQNIYVFVICIYGMFQRVTFRSHLGFPSWVNRHGENLRLVLLDPPYDSDPCHRFSDVLRFSLLTSLTWGPTWREIFEGGRQVTQYCAILLGGVFLLAKKMGWSMIMDTLNIFWCQGVVRKYAFLKHGSHVSTTRMLAYWVNWITTSFFSAEKSRRGWCIPIKS